MKKRLCVAAMLMAASMMVFPGYAEEPVSETVPDGTAVSAEATFAGSWHKVGNTEGTYDYLRSAVVYFYPEKVGFSTGGLDVLPPTDKSLQQFEISEDGTISVDVPEESLPKNLSSPTLTFSLKTLESSDVSEYGITDSELVPGKSTVLVATISGTDTTNPLAPEESKTETIYGYRGYTSTYTTFYLTSVKLTANDAPIAFTCDGDPNVSTHGDVNLNKGETKGTFRAYTDTLTLIWNNQQFEYHVDSVSLDEETLGDVTLSLKSNPDSKLVLDFVEE